MNTKPMRALVLLLEDSGGLSSVTIDLPAEHADIGLGFQHCEKWKRKG